MKHLCFLAMFICLSTMCLAQIRIFGKITDQNTGESLSGATIVLEGENFKKGAASNESGNFAFELLKTGDYTLQVSFIGFENFKQKIQLASDMELNIQLTPSPFLAEEVVVTALRANEKTPIAFSNIDKITLQKQNLGQDLPILLNFMPAVVSTSDAGAGVGYTGIRIRGSDPTRINVTLNGIPLNDAESQGVFWVNMPDFASSVSSIQIQRGVGTSTNGAGAFGASLNIQTNQLNEKPFVEINNSFGSFNTWKHTLQLGSGLIDGKFSLDARLSKINSDGFIDRASSDLHSFYVSGALHLKKTLIRANVFSGKETTYQAWNGIPESRLRGDIQGMNDFISRNFLDAQDAAHLLNAQSRTYNGFTYQNQTDNYQQDHYQLFFNTAIAKHWTLHTALHYTKGRGYYEEYRKNDALANYGLDDIIIEDSTISTTDLVRRRWLDNDFYGAVFSLNYTARNIDFTLGGAWNEYKGNHFGEIIWAQYASNGKLGDRYYDNDAQKNDFNIYTKVYYNFTDKLNAFADVQYRQVRYSFLGYVVDGLGARNFQQTVDFHFFNPKLGFNYEWKKANTAYLSFAMGNKEPNRDDFVQSSADSRPKHETLYNLEAGIRTKTAQWALNVNLYWMKYHNQLVLTGAVNDVGNYNRSNVKHSYRLGTEIELIYQPIEKLTWNFNLTLSSNKIKDFIQYDDDYDNGGQQATKFTETDIAFSPAMIAGSQLEYQAFKNFSIAWLSKYVGKQYLDNTANDLRKLDAYWTNDIRLNYQFKTSLAKEILISLLVNNVLNVEYESNGYTYGYIFGNQRISENFYYPQAGTNFLFALGLKF